MRKLWSLRHWKHVFVRVYRLLTSPAVSTFDKLLFLIPVLMYWVLPDFLPFMPIDDIAVTMVAANFFSGYMEHKYPASVEIKEKKRGRSSRDYP
ncbi:hypothetical protein ABNB59_09205 [Paenibacillus larvae]|uniref:DUF1232 domain-containing protein n=2 Tax=Paenibacillus larvae subsp. larvae TaxID=147375 RepID=V9W1U4_9BACL|nr:hypothetical protein [Paenibacillus larvae]AHD04976.1 hypothetical protein ERIC2_c11430 [Paenibacillus larvae subsp. larvae DSM 25430]AQR78022.1 hypothetical protein BXP28_12490 [Paenibacillus larvae subsp. larvae]AQT85954.1 hypothetical protein B1222_18480 [Paenibacillus larvae subsp. pulvifaciens]AQZ45807.1 hypothetical protein B5S25_03515 [Paenibacillus larvae subsp. pulvifaciens]AVF20817.1 hypothetical protein ERICI_00906 [Paenibacillus larvae subsp. larvae]